MAGRSVELLGIDPGGTTGFSTFDNDEIKSYQIELSKYPRPHEVLYDHLCEVKPCAIIYESFLHRQGQSGIRYVGVEFIGVIQLWAQQNKILCHQITPSQGKAFWTDTKLKALGLYVKGKPHGTDAIRILMTYLMSQDKKWANSIVEKLRDTMRLA
jgi:hypothetical protein